MEREEELSVLSIKAVVKGKGRDQSRPILRGVVYMTKSGGPRTEPWGTPQELV